MRYFVSTWTNGFYGKLFYKWGKNGALGKWEKRDNHWSLLARFDAEEDLKAGYIIEIPEAEAALLFGEI